MDLIERVEALSLANGTSGAERGVRELIVSMLPGGTDYTVDALGNLIVNARGRSRAAKKVMLAAHMDEVGFIATSVCDDGLVKFACVGGISPAVLCGKRVIFENGVPGSIGAVPVHLIEGDKRREFPSADDLYIDIGASDEAEALALVKPGDTAVFESEFRALGEHKIKGKALDDRAGCAVMLELLNSENEYDFTCAFTVQEEVGCRGVGAAVERVRPDAAIVLEATTAADLAEVDEAKKVCVLGKGPAISFMDRSTVYETELYRSALALAEEKGIPAQPKTMVAGGNDSGVIHRSLNGVHTLAVSMPCRYLHSPSCVLDTRDFEAAFRFVKTMTAELCGG